MFGKNYGYDESDYIHLRESIAKVLRRYFEYDDAGNSNKDFDDCYAAQDAIDDIHEIIGDI